MTILGAVFPNPCTDNGKIWHAEVYLEFDPETAKTWRFDFYKRPSSEEAGTQFFRFLTRREDAVSNRWIYSPRSLKG